MDVTLFLCTAKQGTGKPTFHIAPNLVSKEDMEKCLALLLVGAAKRCNVDIAAVTRLALSGTLDITDKLAITQPLVITGHGG